MICPDCKIEMGLIEKLIGYTEISEETVYAAADGIWKCPRCKIEVEEEE